LIVHNSGYTKVKFLSNHRDSWKAILLLSIILPVGLFTGLKLSGIFPTATSETVTLAPVAWLFNLPTRFMMINQTVNATYADDSGQMSFRVEFGSYHTASVLYEYFLTLGVGFTATPLSKGFSIVSILVTYGNDSQPSVIDFINVGLLSFENLTLKTLSSGEEAAVSFLGNGSDVGCQFFAPAYWLLPTVNNVTYGRQVNFEVTYFNGTAYKTVVQPFDLTVQSVGYHYVFIGSVLGDTPSQAPEAIDDVSVWVDGVEHSTPVSLIVKEDVHNITAATPIYINGQGYAFHLWLYEYDNIIYDSANQTWSQLVNQDVHLSAVYRVATGGTGG
jgi:hypothetical protein